MISNGIHLILLLLLLMRDKKLLAGLGPARCCRTLWELPLTFGA